MIDKPHTPIHDERYDLFADDTPVGKLPKMEIKGTILESPTLYNRTLVVHTVDHAGNVNEWTMFIRGTMQTFDDIITDIKLAIQTAEDHGTDFLDITDYTGTRKVINARWITDFTFSEPLSEAEFMSMMNEDEYEHACEPEEDPENYEQLSLFEGVEAAW